MLGAKQLVAVKVFEGPIVQCDSTFENRSAGWSAGLLASCVVRAENALATSLWRAAALSCDDRACLLQDRDGQARRSPS